ncbi:hypothetical protein [uncultured Amnibacterium sp.]|uniref:hypothetical protein n=1 Tax=uncultured Amnibacterium sp. TaxID=1631851 RepID=UPI0035CC8FEC
MAVRDRVALLALAAGVLVGVAAWRLAGPWPAIVVGVLAVLVACAAYRAEAPRIDLDHLPLEQQGGAADALVGGSASAPAPAPAETDQ